MPFVVGLTGSVGMGKSTAAGMFRREGVAIWDADAAVHRLYAKGGAGVAAIREMVPQAIVDGAVNREVLAERIAKDDSLLSQIESAIHPLVARDRAHFLDDTKADIAVLDIPLLFETGSTTNFDLIVVVSAPADIQLQRVLARPGMTRERLDLMRSRQMPDAEKRARADVVIETLNLEDTRATIDALIADILRGRYARNRT